MAFRDIANRFTSNTQDAIAAAAHRVSVEEEKLGEYVAAVSVVALEVAKAGGNDLSAVVNANSTVAAQKSVVAAAKQMLEQAEAEEAKRLRDLVQRLTRKVQAGG